MEKVPTDLKKALTAKPAIKKVWDGLTSIARRDFVRWVEGAKQIETRARRIKVTVSKLASGERRPCCYAVMPTNFYKALGASPKAKVTWHTLTPDERRDLVDWIEEAKDGDARGVRIAKASVALAKGKRRP